MKVSFDVSLRVFFESLGGFSPVQCPEARQLVALVLDHVMRDCSPKVTMKGLADMLTVGAGVPALAIDTVARQDKPSRYRVSLTIPTNFCISIIPSMSVLSLYVYASRGAKCRRIPTSGYPCLTMTNIRADLWLPSYPQMLNLLQAREAGWLAG
jgi:hypothetical protein